MKYEVTSFAKALWFIITDLELHDIDNTFIH